MSSIEHDWLFSASVLQKEAHRLLAAPPRRRTMIEALLKQSSTFARLGCLLAARANETDSRLDYEALEDDFTDATQDFASTLQEVLGLGDSDAVKQEPVSQELGLFEEDTEGELAGLGMDVERLDEGDVGEFEMESMGSQRSEEPDPLEDMYKHMSTCLLRDLQEPLLSQLQDPLTDSLCAPLLAELADPLGSRIIEDICTSQAHLDAIAASLSEHPTLLQALADKIRPQLAAALAEPVAGLGRGSHLLSTSVQSMPATRVPQRLQRALPSPTTVDRYRTRLCTEFAPFRKFHRSEPSTPDRPTAASTFLTAPYSFPIAPSPFLPSEPSHRSDNVVCRSSAPSGGLSDGSRPRRGI